jgi:PHD/YefM family antitoxin component YafN of YafNO toxin-antitoxin module
MTATKNAKDELIALLDKLMGDDTQTPVSVKREGKENLIVIGEDAFDRIMAQAMMHRSAQPEAEMPGVSDEDLLNSLAAVQAPEDDK